MGSPALMRTGSTTYAEREPLAAEPTDHALVAAVRQGDDRAFELLFARYQRRIAAYVQGMVSDHGRTEDITQEIFISALRRMRDTDRPIAFRPWIYEIAKNACIDQFRRSRRSEEVSFDATETLGAAAYDRLVTRGPTPDAVVAQKQALSDLTGAFGGLSSTHHEILVLREFEGLSYREIGERLGMSRASVESTLFRARRRLSEEYGDLASGQRCLRVQALLGVAARGGLGLRDERRLGSHISHCQACRLQARFAGVDAAAMAHRPGRHSGVGAKIAGLLPFPALWRARRGGEDLMAQLSALGPAAEPLAHGWAKAATVATVALAGVGAGVGSEVSSKIQRADRGGAALERRADAPLPAAVPGARPSPRPEDGGQAGVFLGVPGLLDSGLSFRRSPSAEQLGESTAGGGLGSTDRQPAPAVAPEVPVTTDLTLPDLAPIAAAPAWPVLGGEDLPGGAALPEGAVGDDPLGDENGGGEAGDLASSPVDPTVPSLATAGTGVPDLGLGDLPVAGGDAGGAPADDVAAPVDEAPGAVRDDVVAPAGDADAVGAIVDDVVAPAVDAVDDVSGGAALPVEGVPDGVPGAVVSDVVAPAADAAGPVVDEVAAPTADAVVDEVAAPAGVAAAAVGGAAALDETPGEPGA